MTQLNLPRTEVRDIPVLDVAWKQWRIGIVTVLHRHYQDLFQTIGDDEIDWNAWRPLYEQGYTPRIAVEHAISGSFERDTDI